MPVECLGCIVKPFTAPKRLSSEVEVERHFRRQQDEHHTPDLKRRTIEQLTGAEPEPDTETRVPSYAPSEDQIIDKWIQESAEEGYFLRDVAIGNDGTKQADLVVVPTAIENPGSIQLADAELVNRPVADPGPPKHTLPGREFQQLLNNLKGKSIDIQVYEAARGITPSAIGEVVFYARYLPDVAPPGVDIDIVHQGIIYVDRDSMTEEFAQEQGIALHRISQSAF